MNTQKMNFSHMSDSERHWFGRLNRKAEDLGWSDCHEEPRSRSIMLRTNMNMERPEQIKLFLMDSVMVGLYATEPILGLRAYGQAQNYAGILNGMGISVNQVIGDSLTILKNKVEGYLR